MIFFDRGTGDFELPPQHGIDMGRDMGDRMRSG